eukprot:6554088-Alexandrium_andersonii.AAC.1
MLVECPLAFLRDDAGRLKPHAQALTPRHTRARNPHSSSDSEAAASPHVLDLVRASTAGANAATMAQLERHVENPSVQGVLSMCCIAYCLRVPESFRDPWRARQRLRRAP